MKNALLLLTFCWTTISSAQFDFAPIRKEGNKYVIHLESTVPNFDEELIYRVTLRPGFEATSIELLRRNAFGDFRGTVKKVGIGDVLPIEFISHSRSVVYYGFRLKPTDVETYWIPGFFLSIEPK